jgi:hypothetical protein
MHYLIVSKVSLRLRALGVLQCNERLKYRGHIRKSQSRPRLSGDLCQQTGTQFNCLFVHVWIISKTGAENMTTLNVELLAWPGTAQIAGEAC